MRDCDKIEILLWKRIDKSISREDEVFLEKHLLECRKCGKIQSTFEAIAVSKHASRDIISGINAEEFDAAIFHKIRTEESGLRLKREEQGYMFRLYFSVGLAAAIVIFMVLSLGDLDRYIIPIKFDAGKSTTLKKEYDTLHITLKPTELRDSTQASAYPIPEQPAASGERALTIMPFGIETIPDTAKPEIPAMAKRDQEAKLTLADKTAAEAISKADLVKKPIEPEEKDLTVTSMEKEYIEEEAFSASRGKMAPESLARSEAEKGKETALGNYSILSRPVISPAPESVVINSIYLSDESIPLLSQQTRAFLPEVVMDSGIIQAVETPRSILVTVEKMPVPVKIVPPEYPVWALKNGASGVVWVKARVNKNGDVEKAEIVSSNMPGYGFEEASLKAAKECEYIPAEANGIKIGIWVIYPINFIFKSDEAR